MTEAALVEIGRGPTVSLMTRRASAPPTHSPSQAVSASTTSSSTAASGDSGIEEKPRSHSSGNISNAANSENANADSNAKAGGSGPAIHRNHPEDACRYPNKRCYNKRAVKNNGELHKFCDTHRDSANRYQRKLEQRLKEKRIQSRMRALQAQQAQARAQAQAQAQMQAQLNPAIHVLGTQNAMMMRSYPGMEIYGAMAQPHYAAGPLIPVRSSSAPPFVDQSGVVAASGTLSVRDNDEEYEPFHHPVQLHSEDLDCLDLLFNQP